MFRVFAAPCAGQIFAPLFVVASAVLASAASDIPSNPAPAIAIFLDFESEPSPGTLRAMQRETAGILKPSGIGFDWRLMRDRRTGESFPDLVVISLKGSCAADAPVLPEYGGAAVTGVPLAFTRISDGRILPFMDVKCDTVRNYLAREMASARPANRDQVLGRALGRVVAHELYHILADTMVHGHDGVFRSALSRNELTASEFGFSPQETQVLHEQKWKQLVLSTEDVGGQ